jgi:hypothetical protein
MCVCMYASMCPKHARWRCLLCAPPLSSAGRPIRSLIHLFTTSYEQVDKAVTRLVVAEAPGTIAEKARDVAEKGIFIHSSARG